MRTSDLEPLRRFGESFAADPAVSLRRVTLSVRIVDGPEGLRRTELVTTETVDRVDSPASLFPRDERVRSSSALYKDLSSVCSGAVYGGPPPPRPAVCNSWRS